MSRESLVTVVVGGQAGSEAKGSVCAFVAAEDAGSGQAHVAVRVGGSQAGHTAYDEAGVKWPLRHVPVAAVINPDAELVIAAGSEIDYGVLEDEVTRLEAAGHKVRERLWIDPQATVITEDHKAEEAARSLTAKLGSTAKGVGAARADRVMRSAPLVGTSHFRVAFEGLGTIVDTAALLRYKLDTGAHVLIEGVQGFSLGLHAGVYPFCTSADARAIDFLAMAGISPWATGVRDVRVIVVARVYPIRVAGNSGPMRDETTWAELGLPEELTTVTQKVRRVAHFDPNQVLEAVLANGGPNRNVVLAVTMLDQKWSELDGGTGYDVESHDEARSWLEKVADGSGADVALIGTGPQSMHVYTGEVWV